MQEIKIKLPENTTATLSIEDNWAVVEVMAVKSELEVGKWYYDGQSDHIMLYIAANELYGFNSKREWNKWFILASNTKWQPADPKEVTRLLIGEAEKKYGTTPDESRDIGDLFFMEDGDLMTNGYSNNSVVFDGKTGKWAEIIPEKKPLYVNGYGTEWFGDGSIYYTVRLCDGVMCGPYYNRAYESSSVMTEAMTERECHQYLADNWDELKGGKNA